MMNFDQGPLVCARLSDLASEAVGWMTQCDRSAIPILQPSTNQVGATRFNLFVNLPILCLTLPLFLVDLNLTRRLVCFLWKTWLST
jgi:hypothetical protein